MEVILLERIETLGQMGDVVKVKPGYARNYLLPQRKALRATSDNLKYFESQRTQLETENLKQREEAERVAAKMEGFTIAVVRQAGDSGQLYGSVSARDIAEALTASGATVGRRQVVLDRPIKMLGLHSVRIRLHPEVSAMIIANVARSESEAELQAKTGHMVSADEQRATEETVLRQRKSEMEAEESAEPGEEAEPEADTRRTM